MIGLANKFIEDAKPWTLAKEGKKDELAIVIYTLLEALRIISVQIFSFMPDTSRKIRAQLGIEQSSQESSLEEAKVWGRLAKGTKINKTGPLFPRIEIKK